MAWEGVTCHWDSEDTSWGDTYEETNQCLLHSEDPLASGIRAEPWAIFRAGPQSSVQIREGETTSWPISQERRLGVSNWMCVSLSLWFLGQHSGSCITHLVTWNWVCCLVGIEPKVTNRPKNGERENFTFNKWGEHWGSFPKQCLPKLQNWASFKLTIHTYSWRGLRNGEHSMELGKSHLKVTAFRWSHKGDKSQHHQFSGSS